MIIPLLYQSGYITIKDYDGETELYTLGVPNKEIRARLFRSLLPHYLNENIVRGNTTMAKMSVLVKKGDLDAVGIRSVEHPEQYKNQEGMEVMLENGVLSIVNENDTVCITELMFTDNDELSGLIAKMMKADTLLLQSNVDGIYNGDPKDPGTEIIPSVAFDRDISEYIQTSKSSHGRGGMTSKAHTAQEVANAGIKVIIANGNTPNILVNLKEQPEETPHTEFVARPKFGNPKCLRDLMCMVVSLRLRLVIFSLQFAVVGTLDAVYLFVQHGNLIGFQFLFQRQGKRALVE